MRGRRLATWVMAALFGVAGALFLDQGSARAAGSALSRPDLQCLGCHSAKGLETKLANGETLSLHVQGSAFAESVHNMLGCAVCHPNTTLENHPPLKTKIASIRENSLALTQVCRPCHAAIFKQYEGSIHAAILREGNPIAPVCTDCHSPHAVMPKAAYDATTGAPCSKCHDPIFNAYAGSVHGQARKQGRMEAPVCSSCHSAHGVTVPSTSDQPKHACLNCHQDVLRAHKDWLPNAVHHLEVVSCPACHAPTAPRRVDLRLYDSTAGKRLSEKQGVPRFETRARSADLKGVGLDALALQSLLKEFSRDDTDSKLILRGRLEVRAGAEAHQLADKSKAVHECATCHRAGAEAFQSVTVSIVDPDGRPVRHGAQQEVLNSVVSVESVRGFYAIGGTRIKLLDMLVALALLIGVGVPVVHLTLTWIFRRYAKKIGGREDS